MASFDFGNTLNVQVAVPTLVRAVGNVNATAIDTQGYEGLAIVAQLGSVINGTPALDLNILVGADTNVANAVAINSNSIVRDPGVLSTANTVGIYGITFLGNSEDTRYVFPNLVQGASNATSGVIAVQGFPHRTPTT
jgi:hypothetical protein